MKRENITLTAVFGSVGVILIAIVWWVIYMDPYAIIDRAYQKGDVHRLLALAGDSDEDIYTRIHAIDMAFKLMDMGEYSKEYDAKLQKLRQSRIEGDFGYYQRMRNYDQYNKLINDKIREQNAAYIESIASRLVEQIQSHIIPRRRNDSIPSVKVPQKVELVLHIWRDPEKESLHLLPPTHLRYLYNFRGFTTLSAYDVKTRSEIDEHFAHVKTLGVRVHSIEKIGFYMRNMPWSAPNEECKSSGAYKQLVDFYLIDLANNQLIARTTGIYGGDPPSSSYDCYAVGKKPKGYWDYFKSKS